jgi:hypothetical protein
MVASSHSPLVGFADIKPRQVEDYQQFQLEGEQFLHLAEQAFLKEKKAFNTETLYNLITMALEKLVMSGLMQIGRLPFNHTMHDLVEALETWLPAAVAGLEQQLRDLDAFQNICDLENTVRNPPTRDQIRTMLELARIVEQRLATPPATAP